MKKVIVNSNCIGCGACTCIAKEVFTFNEEGYATTIENNNIVDNMEDELKEQVTDALEGCPVSAIEIVEVEENIVEFPNIEEKAA